jgi:AraC family transcriptional regulator, regulatory protein of adaptative response / methylated-DNA-[protein]-cysteine methyltransferase
MTGTESTDFDTDDTRYSAVVARDRAADGQFVYAVRTTGVYCRPSCAARTALRKNVRFFTTPVEAERAGFRACKRCQPDGDSLEQLHTDKVASACRVLEDSETLPALDELARHCGMSRFHFQRVFKRVAGITPGQYFDAHRLERVRCDIQNKPTITDAIYDAGYSSCGQFYSKVTQQLGMKPKKYRAGGKGERIHYAIGHCKLGQTLVAASEKGVCAILLGDDAAELLADLHQRFANAEIEPAGIEFEKTVRAVIAHVDAPEATFDLPLDIRGTAFQQRVWQALMKLPAGEIATYSELAAKIGSPAAVRAVASACAANALAVVIPCHRILRSDGSLSGYRWGVERKARLLKQESTV